MKVANVQKKKEMLQSSAEHINSLTR